MPKKPDRIDELVKEIRRLSAKVDALLPQPEKSFYTLKDVARMLSLPETWLAKRARQGKIPSTKFGLYWRFSKADVEAIGKGLKLEEEINKGE